MDDTDDIRINLETFWPYQIVVLADLISRHTLRIVKKHSDLNLSQWRVLVAIGDHPGRSANEVVAITPMDKGIVSRAVASLHLQGLIEKRPDAADKRRVELFLTPEGQVSHDKISRELQQVLRKEELGISRAELDRNIQVFQRLIGHPDA